MKKTTKSILIGIICTLLLLAGALFLLYKIETNNKEESSPNQKDTAKENIPINNNENQTKNDQPSKENKEETTSTPSSNTNQEENQVTIYVFHGSTCPACQNALKQFKEKKDSSYKNITIKTFEVWGNKDNSALMQKVAEKLNVEARYIPFIIIGNFSTTGYDEKTILSEIKKAEEKKDYQDIVSQVIKENKDLNTSFQKIENN